MNKCMSHTFSLAKYCESSSEGKHMLFAPCDKHIKSSSQEKASLLAAVVSAQCQQEPEEKTMEGNKNRRKGKTINKSQNSDHNSNNCKETGSTIWIRGIIVKIQIQSGKNINLSVFDVSFLLSVVRYHHSLLTSTWRLGINPNCRNSCSNVWDANSPQ